MTHFTQKNTDGYSDGHIELMNEIIDEKYGEVGPQGYSGENGDEYKRDREMILNRTNLYRDHDDATDFGRWSELIDPMATMPESDFDEMLVIDKIKIQADCFSK